LRGPSQRRPDWRQIADGFHARYPKRALLLDDAESDAQAYLTIHREHWRQIWSNSPLELVNREVNRRTDAVGIFPSEAAILRLVELILTE
jgi:transposase-like protein